MPEGAYFSRALEALVNDGAVAEAAVDDKVQRILAPLFAVGVMDETAGPYGNRSANVSTPEHRTLARHLAANASVLLKNVPPAAAAAGSAGLLPLSPVAGWRVVVVGVRSDAWSSSGRGRQSGGYTPRPLPSSHSP